MIFFLAAALAVASVPGQREQVANQSPTETVADDHWKARVDRLDTAIGQMKAKDSQKALDGYSQLLAEYDRLYAGEKRARYCVETDEEARAYVGGLAATPKAMFVENLWCTALWGKAFTLVDLGKLDEAKPFLQRAVEMAPKRPQYLSELGYVEQQSKNIQDSLNLFTRAAEAAQALTDPKDRAFQLARAWRGIGFDMVELGKWDEADAAYRKSLEFDPNSDIAKHELDYIAQNRPKKS